jgi:hypothetical protein
METEVIKQIEKICKADVDINAIILMEFTAAYSRVLDKFEENDDLIQKIHDLEIGGVFKFSTKLLEYWGFETTDDVVGDIIYECIDSTALDKMDIMKKELLEIILETYEN